MPLVLNISGLKIWQGCEYVRVTQSIEHVFIMSQYT